MRGVVRRKAIAEGAARPAAPTQSLGFLKHEDHEVDTKSTKKKEEESQRAQREDAESAEMGLNRGARESSRQVDPMPGGAMREGWKRGRLASGKPAPFPSSAPESCVACTTSGDRRGRWLGTEVQRLQTVGPFSGKNLVEKARSCRLAVQREDAESAEKGRLNHLASQG